MSQATAITITNAQPVSMLDAINPNRARFTLVPTVTKPSSATNFLIEVLAVELAHAIRYGNPKPQAVQ